MFYESWVINKRPIVAEIGQFDIGRLYFSVVCHFTGHKEAAAIWQIYLAPRCV